MFQNKSLLDKISNDGEQESLQIWAFDQISYIKLIF